MQSLIETWEINQKMNELLVNAVDEKNFSDKSVAKGRSVGEQFAHLHNVRLMWLNASIPEALSSLKKFEKDVPFAKQTLLQR